MNNEVQPFNFKRGQVFEDTYGELIMLRAVFNRGDDIKIEYVNEYGYVGSFYASRAPSLKPYTTTEGD